MKKFLALLLPLAFGGCTGTATIQGLESQVGPAVMGLDNAIYSVAIAKYKAAQMFKAEVDGTLVLPPLPPPAPIPAPVPAPVPSPSPVVVVPPPPVPAPTPVPTI